MEADARWDRHEVEVTSNRNGIGCLNQGNQSEIELKSESTRNNTQWARIAIGQTSMRHDENVYPSKDIETNSEWTGKAPTNRAG